MSQAAPVKSSKKGKKADSTIVYFFALFFGVSAMACVGSKYRTVANADTKPFNSFEEFYPHYISQHQDATCRRLHVIGTTIVIMMALWDPFVIPSMVMAATVGYATFLMTKDLPHGLFEMIAMLFTFQFFMRRLTGTWYKGLLVPIIAYSFAWVGHFYFEMNKPATFIYPSYSLAGDFRLWFEVASQERAF